MVKVTIKKDLKDIKKLVPEVRKEFARISVLPISKAIKDDIKSGVSPVKGKGRFKPYSKSYKEQIKGNVAFRRSGRNGKVFVISKKGLRGKQRKAIDEKLQDLNDVFTKNNKKLSPINLTLTGKLINSLIVKPLAVLTKNFRIRIEFTDEKAEFHDVKGAGGSKTLRRMLPTRIGERFNVKIEGTLVTLLNKSISTVVNRQK